MNGKHFCRTFKQHIPSGSLNAVLLNVREVKSEARQESEYSNTRIEISTCAVVE